MDYDVISNLTEEGANMTNATELDEWVVLPHELIFSVFCIISLAANSLIIHTIRTNLSTQVPTNAYLLHIAAFDIAFLLCIPANWMVPLYEELRHVYSFTSKVEILFQCCTILLLIAFSTEIGVKNNIYKKIIGGTWALAGAYSLFCMIFCSRYFPSLLPALLIIMSFIVLMFPVHILQGIIRYRQCIGDVSYKYRFKLVSVYVIIWAPNWACTCVFFLSGSISDISYELYLFTAGLGYLYGVANVIALSFLDKRFKVLFLQTLTCSRNKYVDATFRGESRSNSIVEIDLNVA